MKGQRHKHPMTDYINSGRYEKDCAGQRETNKREFLSRNKAIRELAKSKLLEDKILAIMAARNWYDFDIDDYGVLKFDRFSRSELLHRDMARCIVRFMKTGEFPGICYPGQKDAKFEVEP